MSDCPTVHANCVVVGETGVLIRGASGSGKSSLSLALIELAAGKSLFARLVADDRVRLTAANGRVIASAPREIAGLIERRGFGVVRAPYLEAAVLGLVVDIERDPPRMPAEADGRTKVCGIDLPRLAIPEHDDLIRAAHLTLCACAAMSHCGASALAFAPQHGKMTRLAPQAALVRSGRAGVARGGHDPERNEFCAETA
ncbi:MAG: hypothetical protein ABW275_01590 [Hansschlegelia sp.]